MKNKNQSIIKNWKNFKKDIKIENAWGKKSVIAGEDKVD